MDPNQEEDTYEYFDKNTQDWGIPSEGKTDNQMIGINSVVNQGFSETNEEYEESLQQDLDRLSLNDDYQWTDTEQENLILNKSRLGEQHSDHFVENLQQEFGHPLPQHQDMPLTDTLMEPTLSGYQPKIGDTQLPLIGPTDMWNMDIGNDWAVSPPPGQPLSDDQMDKLDTDFIENVEFIKKIGEGTYGTVWRVRAVTRFNLWKPQEMACKIIRHQKGTRFEVELSLTDMLNLRYLKHENICNLLDIIGVPDSKTGFPYAVVCLFLELCSGNLQNIYNDGKKDAGVPDYYPWCFSERLSKHWFSQMARALSYIHYQGFIHQDIKKLNILYKVGNPTEDTYVSRFLSSTFKLADFGNAEYSSEPFGRSDDISNLVRTLIETGVPRTEFKLNNLFEYLKSGDLKSSDPREWAQLSQEMRGLLGQLGNPPELNAEQIVAHVWCQNMK